MRRKQSALTGLQGVSTCNFTHKSTDHFELQSVQLHYVS